jgi:hypothetical protein
VKHLFIALETRHDREGLKQFLAEVLDIFIMPCALLSQTEYFLKFGGNFCARLFTLVRVRPIIK